MKQTNSFGMFFVADFHTHSHYSRATSKDMNTKTIYKWAQIKGTKLIGTGDFTHPLWLDELKTTLEPAEAGLYKLKSALEQEHQKFVPESCRTDMRYILTSEISCIYSKNNRVRKIHAIVIAPSFESVDKINKALERIGNLRADGRPILGLDVKELLKIVLNADPRAYLVPAHAWTPHFSVFGSNSGFDSLQECFGELTPQIFAIETGLSSDPLMNWRLSQLDTITLISNSDCHSPRKMGREANVFDTDLTFDAIKNAIKTANPKEFLMTIEFFPEEGKYHFDGHRNCGIVMEPAETIRNKYCCPKCGKRLTIGVMHRVGILADRESGQKSKHALPFKNLIPLAEIIADVLDKAPQTQSVEAEYEKLINHCGNELRILMKTPTEEIARIANPLIAEAVSRVREGKVHLEAGYDGEYGKIEVFTEEEKESLKAQPTLF